MRSRGKGKKPLDDEGNKMEDPQILHDKEDVEEEEEDVEEEEEDTEPESEYPPSIHLDSRVPVAYAVLKDILAERRGNWFSGIVRNFRRNNHKSLRWTFNVVTGVVAGTVMGALTGDPFAAIAAAAAGMGAPAVASTARVRMSRLDAQRCDYPDMPEFRDDWTVACYELMRMINGFNLRVEAVARLRRLAEEVADSPRAAALGATANAMSKLLSEWRQELVEIAELLAAYQKEDMESVLTDAQTISTIRILNPLKDGRYDWLSLDPEIIPLGHEQELLDRDLREIACHQGIVDALDPYGKLKRESEKKGEPTD